MKHNVGSYDAGIRYVLGWLIILFGLHFESRWAWFGVVPLLTAALAFCPLYCLAHIDTTVTDR
ncbi:DUF2892 domain-containing protein [Oleiharenicola sp. Vm1]|uniref:YgaP family membrane protein n=1 Tax=Oleiharenicola sp. Vm1 TaxID=3398393 RepID=UPI0039F58E82